MVAAAGSHSDGAAGVAEDGSAMPSTEDLPDLLRQTRRMLGCAAADVPAGVCVADWLRISRFADAVGDENPLYLDPGYGARSSWRTALAPPAFVLAIRVPESSGALDFGSWEAVDVLSRLELWWRDHIRLGDRVSAELRLVGAGLGPAWRGRQTVEITSRAVYRSDGRDIAAATGAVRVHPVRLGRELFIDRQMHRYTDDEITRIRERLGAEPAPRGPRPRFYDDVAVDDLLSECVRGPVTWSELITWIIAEGRPVIAGNLRHRDLRMQPGRVRANPVTAWPISDRRHAREDPQACADAGFPAPCARGSLVVALAAQAVTAWMGDDAFLRHLAIVLDAPVLYGDTLTLAGKITDKFVQRIGAAEYFSIWADVHAVNQLGDRVAHGAALVFLPRPGHPVHLPIEAGQPVRGG